MADVVAQPRKGIDESINRVWIDHTHCGARSGSERASSVGYATIS
jgi:hypothetical protein